MEAGNIYYEWANKLISYENMHAMLLKAPGFETSDSLKNLIASVPLENPDLISSFRYINYVFDHITKKVNESMAAVTVPVDQINRVMLDKSIDLSQQLIRNEAVKKRIIQEFITQYFGSLEQKDRSEILDKYRGFLNDVKLDHIR